MSRLAPKTYTLRALFARSGNQCAFPGCTHPLINDENMFIGQMCHIEAAEKGGERYNPESNEEHRRSCDNLILLCHAHHKETNNVVRYTVSALKRMKMEHEQKSEKLNFKIDEAALFKLKNQMDEYWDKIERVNKLEHIYLDSGLVMEVNGKASFFEVIRSVYSTIDGIEYILDLFRESDERLLQEVRDLLEKNGIDNSFFDTIPYYENPLINRNWEYHNLGTSNCLQRLRIDLIHIEVKYLEEYLMTNNSDSVAKDRLKELKGVLEEYARTAIHID